MKALRSSDDWIRARLGQGTLFDGAMDTEVTYELASAVKLPLPDDSVDYVFTDPPFGSNIFYAVVDRAGNSTARTAERYEALLTGALGECVRVLKPGGWISMVFGNSSGALWSLVQRAVAAARLSIDPDTVALLDKGQRSVKGLASGFENVATLDLVLSMRPSDTGPSDRRDRPARADVERVVGRLLTEDHQTTSSSHLYLELLRHGIRSGWDLGGLDLRHVSEIVASRGFASHPKTGRLTNMARHSSA